MPNLQLSTIYGKLLASVVCTTTVLLCCLANGFTKKKNLPVCVDCSFREKFQICVCVMAVLEDSEIKGTK